MTDPDKIKLLFGPYKPPPLKVGDRAFCLFRDAEVVIYDWSLAPIPWPLCYIPGKRSGGKGLLVEEELARAIRHESSLAIQQWWGVSRGTVRRWRGALGIGRMDAEGSRRLIHQAALGGLNARHPQRWPEVRLWTAEELALVGKLPDAQVAYWTGRSLDAVSKMRQQAGLPAVRAKRGKRMKGKA
jgi:hypothetical protein